MPQGEFEHKHGLPLNIVKHSKGTVMSKEHTATPFKLATIIFRIHQPDPRGADWYDLFTKDEYIGRIKDPDRATYIIQAVNAYESGQQKIEALMEALKQIMTTSSTIIEAIPSVKNSLMIDYRISRAKARTALSQAGKE